MVPKMTLLSLRTTPPFLYVLHIDVVPCSQYIRATHIQVWLISTPFYMSGTIDNTEKPLRYHRGPHHFPSQYVLA